jgi:DNA-binding response OmpR family regulator
MWILVVEDEQAMADVLRQGLEEDNHTVTLACNGNEALSAIATSSFDTVVLDVMMPGIDGFSVARRIREARSQIPILMLTARDTPRDIVKGLDAGADDYLIKPFAFDVLLARLRALARRAERPPVATLHVADLVLDPAARSVVRAGRNVTLTATEFRLLEHLLRRAGRAASRASIIDAVWGFDDHIESNTLDVYIKLLRERIDYGHSTKLIHTVRGYGYILRA